MKFQFKKLSIQKLSLVALFLLLLVSVLGANAEAKKVRAASPVTPVTPPSPTPTTTNYKPEILTSSLPDGKVGTPYSTVVKGQDLNPQDILVMTFTGLPPGIQKGSCQKVGTINYSCQLVGTPTLAGTYFVKIELKDNKGAIGKKNVTLIIKEK